MDSHKYSYHPGSDVSVLKVSISNLENEIGVIFKQIQQLKLKSINKNFLLEKTSKKTQLPTTKLRSYQSKIQSIFHKTNHYQELQKMKDNIAEKKQALYDLQILLEINAESNTNNISQKLGITESEIQNEIGIKSQQLHKIKIGLLSSVKELEVQVNNLKEEKLQIEQTIKIIHKRNAAQLLRLKRLINEARLREQHWSAEIQKCLNKIPHTDRPSK